MGAQPTRLCHNPQVSSRSHPFRAIGALVVVTVLAPAGLIGLAGVTSDTGIMRPVMGMLVGAAILGIGGAIHTFRDALAAAREESAAATTARAGLPENFVAHDDAATLLGRWSISQKDAKPFAEAEWSRRKREVPFVAGCTFVGGSALLLFTKGGPAWAAFAAGGFMAVLYLAIGLAKYRMEYDAAMRFGQDVVVWDNAILVLGTHHSLAGLTSVALANNTLELGVRWETRDGTVQDTLIVPVPEGAWPTAVQVARALRERMDGTRRETR